jgi:GT2 family glycosyltransferase
MQKTMKRRTVGVVILNYNCAELLRECITSVLNQSYPVAVVIFVDNASTDGSYELVRTNFKNVISIRNEENIGLAGLNIGIKVALEHGCDYIMYLDSDAKLDFATIEILLRFLEANPRCGIVGPTHMKYVTKEPYFIGSYIDLSSVTSKPAKSNQDFVECDYVGNSLIRREILNRILFDESFFVYYGDTDLCLNAKKLGYKVCGLKKAKLYSMERYTSSKIPGLRGYLSIRNKLLFAHKHSPTHFWMKVLISSIYDAISRFCYWISHKSFTEAAMVWIGFVSGIFFLLFGKEPVILRILATKILRMVRFSYA